MANSKIEVFGLVKDISFHEARCCAEDLFYGKEIKTEPEIHAMTEIEWDEFVTAKKRELEGETWGFEGGTMIFVDGQTVGDTQQFVNWASIHFNYVDHRPHTLYVQLTEEAYKHYLGSKKHDYVYMNISVGNEFKGKLVIELFTDKVPVTCSNFLNLCTGDKGISKANGYPLIYEGSNIHRVVKNGWIQGGGMKGLTDIWLKKGDGGESIYGETFEDENFSVSHDRRGIVGMANKGNHSNGSQFYITLQPATWMDTKHVAFGYVIEGCDTLKAIEEIDTQNDRPITPITITKTGVVSSKY